MSQLPCPYCDAPIPASEAERTSLCPVCSRPLTVCGRYKLRELLGRSSSGLVYGAVTEPAGQRVVVKALFAKPDDWTATSEFERQARTVQSIKERALPQILGWERAGQGRLMTVRERLDGGTLAQRIDGGTKPSPADLGQLVDELARLMAALHWQSPPLLHREIKASNILFRSAGDWRPVLVDFSPFGTDATPTSDLFALGAALMYAAGQDRLRFGSRADVVARLIDPNPAHRFATGEELVRALGEATARPHGQLRPAGASAALPTAQARTDPAPLPRLQPPPQRRRTWVWVVVLAVFWGLRLLRHLGPSGTTPPPPAATKPPTPVDSDGAVARYRRECDKGNATSCYNLGYRYEKGRGVAADLARAAQLYGIACSSGELMACNNLGVFYEHGRGVAKDPARAAPLYERACDAKDMLACKNLGYLYSNGLGVKQDIPRAVKLYARACDANEYRGCYNLGWVYENGKGVPLDYSRALQYYKKGCDGKDAESCTNLGWMHATAKGVAEDLPRSRQLYQTACDGGDGLGCNNLGVVYEKGRGVEADSNRAVSYYRQACESDDYYGCSNLGYMYEMGKGVSRDGARATQLYQQSCKMGYDKGCNNLLDMCKDSRTRAYCVSMVRSACKDGDAWSCTQLPKLHD